MKIDLTPLEIAQQAAGAINAARFSSLPEYTASTRLAPIVLIDKRVLVTDPKLTTALLQTLLSVYCSYYLTAINLSMQVGNVKVMRLLDQFSTNRDLLTAASNNIAFTLEDIDDDSTVLPNYSLESGTISDDGNVYKYNKKYKKPNYGGSIKYSNTSTTSNNNSNTSTTSNNNGAYQAGLDKARSSEKPYSVDKTIHNIIDESNLAVGKLLEVHLVQGNQSVTIPVHATLVPKSIEPEDFIDIAKANSVDKSASGRWHQWRAGEIRFIKDYLLTQDLIEADKKALLADKTGTLLSTRSKRTKGVFAALLSGYASPNAVSTMIIISKQTASDLELAIKGSLKNAHVRQQYFESNSTMMLVVVDVRMERFTIYQRGIADYKEHTLEDIKGNNSKTNGTDLEAILKAYQLGNAAPI